VDDKKAFQEAPSACVPACAARPPNEFEVYRIYNY
jgi:hypothetical protein